MSLSATKSLLETLQIAEKAVSRERNRRLTAIGLTVAQAQILTTLQSLGSLSLSALSDELPTDAPPSRVVSALVRRKLVTRRDQASDRRNVEIALSVSGRKKIREIRRIDQAVNRWATRKLQRMPIKSAQKALAALGEDS
ncbi:MAG: MarR family transcriptional regulator [Gammaproteobacteria bacterium]|nr:MarR family transcriptional regulator [Gammaproteobacteria bacterium]